MNPSATPSPAALAGRFLFEPIAPWLARFPEHLPDACAFNALLAQEPRHTGDGQPLRFAEPRSDGMGYEARIAQHGVVEHRSNNWHDFFNALVWLEFPQAKAALSARHGQELAQHGAHSAHAPRGCVRDALTQFDECGIVVLSSHGDLNQGLHEQRWAEVFWQQRPAVQQHMRFIVFGHATYDLLQAPFPGLCAKALYLDTTAYTVHAPWSALGPALDNYLAHWLQHQLMRPKDLRPLPLLGIPGLTPESEFAQYYQDTRQFRPLAQAPQRQYPPQFRL